MTPIYQRVIVGTDGSNTATCAVRKAAHVAGLLDVGLTVATAWRRHPDDTRPLSEQAGSLGANAEEAAWATDVITDSAGLARTLGLADVRTATPVGHPAEALMRLGEEQPGILTVVGTAGLSARAERIVGNVPHQLTHHATNDLLLVATDDCDEREPGWRTVALATDGSSTAAVAAEHGLDLARRLGATPTVLTVAGSQEAGDEILDRAMGQFRDQDGIERHVAVGSDISRTLIEAAAGFDLLVVGNKGMSGPSRLLGSVSNKVTHVAPTDLLLVNTTR